MTCQVVTSYISEIKLVSNSMATRELVGFTLITENVLGSILNTILLCVFIFNWKTLQGQFTVISIFSLTLGSLFYTTSVMAVIILCLSDGISTYPTLSIIVISIPRIAYLIYMLGLLHIAFERLTIFYHLPLLMRPIKYSVRQPTCPISIHVLLYCSFRN